MLVVIGTRGDVEPFLSFGEKLLEQGHEIQYCLPEQLGSLVPAGTPWVPLDRGFLEMLEGPEGRALMSGYLPPLEKARVATKLARQGIEVNRNIVEQQFRALDDWNPDQVICHPKCAVALLWANQKGRRFAFLSPIPFYVHPDPRQPHTGINGNFGSFFNRLSFLLINAAFAYATRDSARTLPGISRPSFRKIYREIKRAKFMFAVSPSLYPRLPAWGANVQIIGHSTRKSAPSEMKPHLAEFLSRHPQVLVVTFGSMLSSMPECTSQLIYESLRDIGCPVVVNLASGGLVRIPEFERDPRFCFVETVSYPDLLPHAQAIIHHGGSGTTHLGLKFGCPTLILPHVFDQFTWGGLIASIGAGPAPIAVNRIKRAGFTATVRDLLENPTYKQNAMTISAAMGAEPSDFDLDAFLAESSSP